MKDSESWPSDADGDVLRRLQASDFDFGLEYNIDFNVDFESWPPPSSFLEQLRATYPSAQAIDPDQNDNGYVRFVVRSRITYQLVKFVQQSVSQMAAPFGGVCESWGVLH